MQTTAERRNDDTADLHAMMASVVDAVVPIRDCISGRHFQLVAGAPVTHDEAVQAIFMATGTWARDTHFVTMADLEAGTVPREYRRTLEQGVESLLGFRLLTELGSKRWQQMRRQFGYDAVIPLTVQLMHEPERLPRKNLRAALFHFWGSAIARHQPGLERLLPLIRLLPRAIPLGELKATPGTWVVLTA